MTIEELWRQHQASPFPDCCRGEEIAGVDLTLLDANAAGCICAFVATRKRLDVQRVAMLRGCYADLGRVVRALKGDGKEYFQRLHQLIGLILK